MKIIYSKTRERYPLSYKKIIKKTLMRTVILIIISLLTWAFITFVFSETPEGSVRNEATGWFVGVTISIFVLLSAVILLTYLYQRWYFAVYFYDLTPDFIRIKKGPITPREITVPYERIQDVYVDQDILDRIFGLYDLHLSSATISSGMEAHIDGLEKQAAEELRDLLLQTIKQKISKDKNTGIPVNSNSVN